MSTGQSVSTRTWDGGSTPTSTSATTSGRFSWRPRTRVDAARADLIGRGVEVSEVFHRDSGQLVPGPDPERRSYLSYASFSDPDGNGWLLQEITTRLPGRVWDD